MDVDERLKALEEQVAALLELNASLARGRDRREVGGATLDVLACEQLVADVGNLTSERDEARGDALRLREELEQGHLALAALRDELNLFRRRRGVRAAVWFADRVPRPRGR